jgi:esterase/lipase superfamily enzyme
MTGHMGKSTSWIVITAVLGVCLAASAATVFPAEAQEEGNSTLSGSGEHLSVPFVTLRNRTGSSSPEDYFGGTRGEPRAGFCTVAFSPIRGLGEIAEAVPFYIPDEQIELTEVRETPLKDLFSGVETFLDGDNGNVVIYIHGYKIDFEKSCERSAIFQRALGLHDRLLLFSWPADGNMLKYTWDESDLIWSVPYLARFIDEIVRRAGKGKVDVVAHSLGARGAVQALARMAYRDSATSILNELVLIAPDIDTDIFRQELPLVRKTAIRITVYASDNDKALKLSHEVHGYPRLGMAGEHLTVLEGVETIDISAVGTRRLSGHIYHLFNPEVIEDLTQLLHTGKPAAQRPGLQAVENDGLTSWRLAQ